VLCCLHTGLLAASQSPQNKSSVSDPVDKILDLGKQLRDSGHADEAIATFSKAVKLANQRKDLLREGRGLVFLGSAQLTAFHYRAALKSLQEGSAVADRLHELVMAGAASGNIATIYSILGDLIAANANAEQAVSFLERIQKPDDKVKGRLTQALLIHSSICFQLGKSSEGYKDSDRAISLAESIGDQNLLAGIWDKRGFALLEENKIAEANEAFQKARSLSEQNRDENDLVYVKEHLAELELKKLHPDYRLALRLIDEAFATHNPKFNSSPQYYPIHIRARILLESGNKSAALSEFMRAVTAANQWRMGALPGDITSSQTVAVLQQVYADYAQLAAETALENKDNTLAANALEVLAMNRAASLREQLRRVYARNFKFPDEYFFKLAQLQSAQAQVTLGSNDSEEKAQLSRILLEISDLENQIGLKPEKLSVLEERIPRRNSLRDIQRTLGRDQVLISITLGKHRSYMWAVTADKVNLSRLPGEGELTSKAGLFVLDVRNGHKSSSSAVDFSRALFAGLPADVWNRSEWMMVADGSLLNGVPFCALPDLHSGRPLIESKSLRFLPSELLLLDWQTRAQARIESAGINKGFVGIGDPIYNLADARLERVRFADARTISSGATLARLVGSEKEIQSAAKETGFPTPVLLTGTRATRENLVAALNRDTSVVHFAVHVVSPPDQPQQAALALSIKNGIPELLTPEVIASLHVPGSLVVLSGCSSGQGKILPGVGLVGLSRAWLLAGAAAVVVSSWPTPDDSGSFFSSFYSHFDEIHSGNTAQRAALALRRTQLDMLNGSHYQTSPTFWGAFAVISKE
jgi:tetratricopeptide (TPR) repeat protein